jgi:hypothetical protein
MTTCSWPGNLSNKDETLITRILVLVSLLAILPLFLGAQETAESTFGTLVTTMGNQEGIVVVPDSMAWFRDSTGLSEASTCFERAQHLGHPKAGAKITKNRKILGYE